MSKELSDIKKELLRKKHELHVMLFILSNFKTLFSSIEVFYVCFQEYCVYGFLFMIFFNYLKVFCFWYERNILNRGASRASNLYYVQKKGTRSYSRYRVIPTSPMMQIMTKIGYNISNKISLSKDMFKWNRLKASSKWTEVVKSSTMLINLHGTLETPLTASMTSLESHSTSKLRKPFSFAMIRLSLRTRASATRTVAFPAFLVAATIGLELQSRNTKPLAAESWRTDPSKLILMVSTGGGIHLMMILLFWLPLRLCVPSKLVQRIRVAAVADTTPRVVQILSLNIVSFLAFHICQHKIRALAKRASS